MQSDTGPLTPEQANALQTAAIMILRMWWGLTPDGDSRFECEEDRVTLVMKR